MEEKTVLGTTIAGNGKVLWLFAGETTPVWGQHLQAGQSLPKAGTKVHVVERPNTLKPEQPWHDIFW